MPHFLHYSKKIFWFRPVLNTFFNTAFCWDHWVSVFISVLSKLVVHLVAACFKRSFPTTKIYSFHPLTCHVLPVLLCEFHTQYFCFLQDVLYSIIPPLTENLDRLLSSLQPVIATQGLHFNRKPLIFKGSYFVKAGQDMIQHRKHMAHPTFSDMLGHSVISQ